MKIIYSYFLSYIFGVIILSCFFIFKASGQNLVPNSDFETYSTCPANPELIEDAPPWSRLAGGGGGTPDYFNSCATYMPYSVPSNVWGNQNAHSGKAYALVGVYISSYPNAREYIQVMLKDSLKAGKEYCVEFYISAADNLMYVADGIGAYFSKSIVSSSTDLVLPYTPQIDNPVGNILTDTTNWMKVSGSFIASGGEQYLVIGNFRNDKNTKTSIINNGTWNVGAGYYIDDVSVRLTESANAGIDKNICLGDSAQIGTVSNEAAIYSWSPAIGLSNSNAAHLWLHQLKQQLIYLQKQLLVIRVKIA